MNDYMILFDGARREFVQAENAIIARLMALKLYGNGIKGVVPWNQKAQKTG